MYHHILIAVGYGEGQDAGQAVAAARALAHAEAQVTLIHVMEPAPLFALTYLPEGWDDDMRAALGAELGQIARGFARGHVAVTEGDPATEILDYAATHGVDCIIVASHRPGTLGLMLGSTAAKIVNRAQCAVHVARRA